MHELESMKRLIRQATIWGLLIAALLALIGGAVTRRTSLRRIGAINATVAEITAGDLSRRIPADDAGSGIPEADREAVFRRFYRLDSSRSSPGSGLGLSLVGAVARLHHLEIRLEDNPPGLRAVMEWPSGSVVGAGAGPAPDPS